MTQRFSLTTRLTLFYTLASATVLLGLGWLTSVAMNRHFEDLDRATLEDKIHLIQEVSGKATSRPDLQANLNDILHSHEGLFVSIHRNGQTIYATSELKIPNETVNVGEDPQTQPVLRWQNGGHEYRALGALLPSPTEDSEAMTVWVALDTQHHAHFQRQFQTTLVAYVIFATLFSGLLGWIAARRGLAPLRIMKSRAQAVTSNKMGERMPVAAVPVEMADLAVTLNDMLDRLQEDFRRLSEFSSDLAHELRTPISNLLTETQVTLSMARTNADYQDVLASNSEELQRLARMVSDMLFLAKTEHGLALPSRERISVATEVQALFDFYEALASEKGLRLELVGDGSIHGDRLMLRRALSNLLYNALRYATPNSAVAIHIQTHADNISVCVTNEGVDISPEMQPRLFDRFFRVDKSRAHPDSDGAGLGLAITRAIMEAHGGRISVTSLAGQTCFSLVFPDTFSGPTNVPSS
ncbi:Sensor kinase CusS [Curvibacter sp. AEP1-3]|uniref:heavy metal sensor histidine kinase n=1 Tax=Curvibacter sp. AEP1-3 TaxID=1844971 RepID=UPI000B3C2AC9|nr:heavy metal sensor histidine kinase [Curvibacter sp. AEP1-3]ARV19556.1 Sensor kinase CusS [Curvibacter sp. AEP1-3]